VCRWGGNWCLNFLSSEKTIAWVRSLYERSAPLSRRSVYINFVPEPGEKRSLLPFGSNEPRLRQIKARLDPTDLFRANVPIKALGA
jgi:hypothetical protein